MSDSEKKDKIEVKASVAKFKKEADDMLDSMGTVHKFEMNGVCSDKQETDTQVLIIDTDRKGVLGMYMRQGQPVTLGASGEMTLNEDKLFHYLNFMSNVDLENEDNHEAIGWAAISKAREVVRAFFTLRLASSFGDDIATAK